MSDVALWPYNVVDVVAEAAAAREGVDVVVKRPIKEDDPTNMVGVFAQDWVPGEFELGMRGPTIARYQYRLQVLVKHGNEEEGQRAHAVLSKSLRSMLYLDPELKVAFSELTEDQDGRTEQFAHQGVATQRFFSQEIGRTFVYLSTIDFWVETQTQ